MAKRGLAFCFFLMATILLSPLAVNADTIWEFSNDFYKTHKKECKYLGEVFYVNGWSGVVFAKIEPGSCASVGSIFYGETCYVVHTYEHRGEQWGIIVSGAGGFEGWVPMNQLIPSAQKQGLYPPLLIVILVALLVVVTSVLIQVFWKPQSEGGDSKNDDPSAKV
jgi:hypothetical protein